MIGLLRRNPWIAALGVLCAVLLAVIAYELVAGAGASRLAAPRKVAAAEAKLLPAVVPATAEAYPETVARPLWIPTRRPAPAALAAAPSIPRGLYTLHGVIITGDLRVALLREKASGRIHRVEKGKELSGLLVAEVENEAVTLAQGAEREVVELRVQKGSAPGPAGTQAEAGPATSASAPRSSPGVPIGVGPGFPVPATASSAQGPFAGPPPPAAALPVPGTAPGGAVPSPSPPQATTPMTPEELLARRRARRNQTP